MRKLIVVAIAGVLIAGMAVGASAMELYVSPAGSDKWDGSIGRPFATPERAHDAARGPAKPATIWLRKGDYFLKQTLVLDGRDSDTTYAAYRGEDVTISGGRPITGFKPAEVNGRKMLAAQIPEVKQGKWYFTQLFVNGIRRPRTRLPKEGWYTIAGLDETPAKYKTRQDHFRFNPGEIKASWAEPKDIDLVILHYWVSVHTGIKSVDEAAHTVWLTKPSHRRLTNDFNTKSFARYYLENVFEALDTPGQWYLDRKAGVLYYYPLEGEDAKSLQVVAPAMEQVIEVQGSADKPAHDVAFKSIRFANSQHFLAADEAEDFQAAWRVPGAVVFENAVGCSLANCEVSRVGTYAVQIGPGCRDCRVEKCRIFDLGAGGVKMEQGSESSTVADNEVFDGGRIFRAGEGIWVGDSGKNKVLHNEVHDFDYTGISVGWVWGYGKSNAKENSVEFNHIYNIGRGVLSDMGGIYMLGVSPGTRIANNVIHDVQSATYGGWGIYTDQGSTDIVIENNVVYHTKSGGFVQNYGKNNIIRNNILAFGKDAQIHYNRPENHTGIRFERNIVYYDQGTLLSGRWSNDKAFFDYNCYWDASGRPIIFDGSTLEQWRKRGHDEHSIIADPLFVNARTYDFRLKPDSPALKLGFKQIDVSTVGPRGPVGCTSK